MWPFDYILQNRINGLEQDKKYLERTVEILTGANQVLTQQLENAQFNEKYLQNKIFDITGVNRNNGNHIKETTASTEPIRVGNRSRAWPEVRQSLEAQSKLRYWKDKEAREKKASSPEEIDKLEQDVMGGIEDAK